MNKKIAGLATGMLMGWAFAASAQNTPTVQQKLAALNPGCQAEVAHERESFAATVKRGLETGQIDAKERADLEKTHNDLLAMEKKALEDGNMNPQECQAIHTKIAEQNAKLKAALASRPVRTPIKRPGFVPPKHQHVGCQAEIAHEREGFVANVKRGLESGQIDAKERADLEKTHNELLAMEKKANEDGKLSAQECQAIHNKVMQENAKLKASLAARPGKMPPKPMPPIGKGRHPHMSCLAEIKHERESFVGTVQRGVETGQIDTKERADLEKTHNELLAMEKKASEDGKMTPQECQGIHAKITEQNSKLKAALAGRPVKTLPKRPGFVPPKHAQVGCQLEIAREREGFVANVKRGLEAGQIDAKERADLEKTHNELLAMEKKASEDGKLSAQECQGIHAKVMQENMKLKAALANRPGK